MIREGIRNAYLEIGNAENKLESDGVLKNNEIWVEGGSRETL